MEIPQKNIKIELPYDPASPLLGIYLEKMKTVIQKDTCTPMFMYYEHSNSIMFTIYNSEDMKATQVPISG